MEEEEEYIPMSSPGHSIMGEVLDGNDVLGEASLTPDSQDEDEFYTGQTLPSCGSLQWLGNSSIGYAVELDSSHCRQSRIGALSLEQILQSYQDPTDNDPIIDVVTVTPPPEPQDFRRGSHQKSRSKKVGMNGNSADLLAFLRMNHSGEVPRENPELNATPKDCNGDPMRVLINWQSTSASRRLKQDIAGCVVCESEKAGYHFGVTACAACSAFFRRTISERRKYVCRKTGPDHLNCPIDKRHRCYCRACRLQKCLAKGMDPTAVQPHRDSIGTKRGSQRSSPALPMDDSGDQPMEPFRTIINEPIIPKTEAPPSQGICATTLMRASPDLIIPKEEAVEEDEPISQETFDSSIAADSLFACRPSSASTGTLSDCLYDPHQNLIEIMVEQYRKLLERRRLVYCPSSIHAILSGAPPAPRPAKFFDRVRRHHIRIELGLFVEFLNSIHPFSKLPVEDKVALVKHLSVSFSILEKYYCTMRGGGLQTNRIIHSDGTYTDLDNPSSIEFDTNDVSGGKMDNETLNKWFITPLRDALHEISAPMFHYGMNDVEFCALVAILLFDPSALGLVENTRRIVKDGRDRVYQDWFSYYRAHGVSDACERVGNTMLLLPAVQATVEKTAENFTLIRVFELFEYDKILDELFSKDSSQPMDYAVPE